MNKIIELLKKKWHSPEEDRVKYDITITGELYPYINDEIQELVYPTSPNIRSPLVYAIAHKFNLVVKKLLPLTQITEKLKNTIIMGYILNEKLFLSNSSIKLQKFLLKNTDFANWKSDNGYTKKHFNNLTSYMFAYDLMCIDFYEHITNNIYKNHYYHIITHYYDFSSCINNYKLVKLLIKYYSNLNYKQFTSDKLKKYGANINLEYLVSEYNLKKHNELIIKITPIRQIYNWRRKYQLKYKYIFLCRNILAPN
jgi:hypothetical protein